MPYFFQKVSVRGFFCFQEILEGRKIFLQRVNVMRLIFRGLVIPGTSCVISVVELVMIVLDEVL